MVRGAFHLRQRTLLVMYSKIDRLCYKAGDVAQWQGAWLRLFTISRDCRFDPCRSHTYFVLFLFDSHHARGRHRLLKILKSTWMMWIPKEAWEVHNHCDKIQSGGCQEWNLDRIWVSCAQPYQPHSEKWIAWSQTKLRTLLMRDNLG